MNQELTLNAWLKKLVYEANAMGYRGNVVDDFGINHWVGYFRDNCNVDFALDANIFLNKRDLNNGEK